MTVTFFVPGIPAPQGSKRHVGKGRMVESCKSLGPWRADVKAFAVQAMSGRPPMSGAIAASFTFWFARPNSLGKKIKYKISRPDVSKLVRAAEDAMTNVVYFDDAQIVDLRAMKCFVGDGSVNPGMRVQIDTMED